MSIPNVQPLPSKSPPSCQAAKPGGRGQTNYRVCEGSEQALSGTEGKVAFRHGGRDNPGEGGLLGASGGKVPIGRGHQRPQQTGRQTDSGASSGRAWVQS